MNGTPEELQKFKAEETAAKETLSLMLDDVHENACAIDEQCRHLVKEVMASLETFEHDYAPEFLEAIGKIWGAAHCIRRSVERDDAPKSTEQPATETDGAE